MAIPIDREHKQIAKQENKFILQLSIEGKYRTAKKERRTRSFTGCVPDDLVEEFLQFYDKLLHDPRI